METLIKKIIQEARNHSWDTINKKIIWDSSENDILRWFSEAKNLPQYDVSPNEGQQLSSDKKLPEVALPSDEDLKLIIESNDITRSFYQIIARRGKETNWEAIEKRVEEILSKQYKRIYQRGNGG